VTNEIVAPQATIVSLRWDKKAHSNYQIVPTPDPPSRVNDDHPHERDRNTGKLLDTEATRELVDKYTVLTRRHSRRF